MAESPVIGSRRTTWPAAIPLQQAADRLRGLEVAAPPIDVDLADPIADLLEEFANTLAWLAPYREHEGGYGMWETAMRLANLINGTIGPNQEPTP